MIIIKQSYLTCSGMHTWVKEQKGKELFETLLAWSKEAEYSFFILFQSHSVGPVGVESVARPGPILAREDQSVLDKTGPAGPKFVD